MKKSTLSFIRSKLYKESQPALSIWADNSLEILSRLLGVSLSWVYEVEPIFEPKVLCLFSRIWLPATSAESLVSQSLCEIFNLKFKSQIKTGKYSINSKIQELQDLTLSMEIRRLQLLTLYVSLDKKVYLTLDLYPILYDRNQGVWLDSFTLTYNVKEAAFDTKINSLYYGIKPRNLSDKDKENMLELAKIVPSMSEWFSLLINSTEVETLKYTWSSDSDAQKMFYTYFMPGETLNRQGLILNWCFSLNLMRTT